MALLHLHKVNPPLLSHFSLQSHPPPIYYIFDSWSRHCIVLAIIINNPRTQHRLKQLLHANISPCGYNCEVSRFASLSLFALCLVRMCGRCNFIVLRIRSFAWLFFLWDDFQRVRAVNKRVEQTSLLFSRYWRGPRTVSGLGGRGQRGEDNA